MAIFNNNEDDNERDFFEEIPDEEPQIKEPVYTEDDPRYWDRPDDRWEHLRPRHRTRMYIIFGVCLLLVALITAIWLRYFSPYVSDAVQYGYIEHIESRGLIFKTDEGVLLPYRNIMDTTRAYNRDFIFSAESKNVSAKLRRYEQEHRPVRVIYDIYNATLPWRGVSKIIVTQVDSVDESKLLPPGYDRLTH